MNYDPNIHHRRSIRLKGYDYSQAGMYFITICTQNRVCLFGEIINDEMVLNDAGKMVEKWWNKIAEKFPDIDLGDFVIMPNHFHCIVVNTGVGVDPRINPKPTTDAHVGVDPRVNPESNSSNSKGGEHMGSPLRSPKYSMGEHVVDEQGDHVGSPQQGSPVHTPVYAVVQWFKTMTTNEYIRGVKQNQYPPFDKKIWQRNYWEHIIRDQQSFENISNYIRENPTNWEKDKLFSQ